MKPNEKLCGNRIHVHSSSPKDPTTIDGWPSRRRGMREDGAGTPGVRNRIALFPVKIHPNSTCITIARPLSREHGVSRLFSSWFGTGEASQNETTIMERGTVKWFSSEKGYGFIAPESGGDDVFVHHSNVGGGKSDDLRDGETVEFETEQTEKGLSALNVSRVDDSGGMW